MVPEPRHQSGGEQVALTVVAIRGPARVAVGDRRQQQLTAQRRPAGVTCQLCRHGGDVGPGAPAGHGQLPGDAAELDGVVGDPPDRSEGVVGRCREPCLGSVAVVHRHDHRIGTDAQVAAERIVRRGTAQHPAPAVEVGHDRVRSIGSRSVQAVGEIAARSGQHPVDDLADVGPGWTLGRRRLRERARLVGGHRFDRRQAHAGEQVEHRLHVGLQLTHDAVVALGACGAVELEAQVVVGHHLGAHLAVRTDTTHVGQEHPWLARHVGAHVPRVRSGVEGDARTVVHVLHPARFGSRCGLDGLHVAVTQVGDAVGHPVDVLFDRHRHVGEHRRTAGAGDGEEVRETHRGQTQVRGGSVRPLLLQRHAMAPGDVHRHDRPGHRVETGGEHDGIELACLVAGDDAGLGDRGDRRLAQVHQVHVRQVERGEVIGVEAWPLGAEGVVLGAQRLSRLGVVHDGTDLLADHLGHDVVGGGAHHDVVEHAQDLEQFAGGPGRIEALAAQFVGREQRAVLGGLAGNAAARPLGRLSVTVAVRFQRRPLLGEDRPVARRHREVRRPLVHRELGCLSGDERDRLDTGRTGTDHRNTLAGEIHTLVRPTTGEIHLAGEPVGAFDVGALRQRQTSRGHHVMAARDLLALSGTHTPPRCSLVPHCRLDPGVEVDAAPQVVLVGDELEVPQDLRLCGVLLGPGPLRFELGVEGVRVVGGRNVASGTRVAVPVPGASHVVGGLQDPSGQAQCSEPMQEVEPGEPGAHHHDIDVTGSMVCSHACFSFVR